MGASPPCCPPASRFILTALILAQLGCIESLFYFYRSRGENLCACEPRARNGELGVRVGQVLAVHFHLAAGVPAPQARRTRSKQARGRESATPQSGASAHTCFSPRRQRRATATATRTPHLAAAALAASSPTSSAPVTPPSPFSAAANTDGSNGSCAPSAIALCRKCVKQ